MKKVELAKKIKMAVKELVASENGCATIKLDNRLAVCVGWSEGYEYEEDNQFIHSKNNPSFTLVVGLKVWASDDLRTDYDWINYPYTNEGAVLDIGTEVNINEDYESLAEWLLEEYTGFQNIEISKDGLINNII